MMKKMILKKDKVDNLFHCHIDSSEEDAQSFSSDKTEKIEVLKQARLKEKG